MHNIEVEIQKKKIGFSLSIGTILIVGPMMSKGKRKDYQVGLCASRLHYLQTVKFPSAGSLISDILRGKRKAIHWL